MTDQHRANPSPKGRSRICGLEVRRILVSLARAGFGHEANTANLRIATIKATFLLRAVQEGVCFDRLRPRRHFKPGRDRHRVRRQDLPRPSPKAVPSRRPPAILVLTADGFLPRRGSAAKGRDEALKRARDGLRRAPRRGQCCSTRLALRMNGLPLCSISSLGRAFWKPATRLPFGDVSRIERRRDDAAKRLKTRARASDLEELCHAASHESSPNAAIKPAPRIPITASAIDQPKAKPDTL